MLTQDQFLGVVRAVLSGVGGVLVSMGWMADAGWQQIAGVAVVIATSVWSVVSKKA